MQRSKFKVIFAVSLFVLAYSDLLNALSFRSSIELGMKYNTNVFYSDDNLEAATASMVKPKIGFDHKSTRFYSKSDIHFEQLSISKYSEASESEYDASLETGWGTSAAPKLALFAEAKSKANPLFSSTATKAPVMVSTKAGLKGGFSFGKKHAFSIDAFASNESLDQSNFEYLNNSMVDAGLKYSYKFLPETSFYTEIRGGQRTYDKGTTWIDIDSDDLRVKYDSDILQLLFGVEGRLTKYTSIDAGFGLRSMDYTADKDFKEPIFYVRFTDQISPKDSIIAGYLYEAKDSKYTNWVLEQDMYIGYSRILRDTFLFLMKLNYIYYSYSELNRREDQRLLAKFQLDYVFLPKWTFVSTLGFDLLVSDAYDTDTSSSDRAASYRATTIGLSVKRSF